MVTLLVTLGPLTLQTTPTSTFCIAFHVFVDFEFGMQVDKLDVCSPCRPLLIVMRVMAGRHCI